jgi:predicted ATPase/signal transduction histidine kinase
MADPPARAVTIHEGVRSRVIQVTRADGMVIRKEPLGPDAERRLRHETAILERLRGAAGLAQLADEPARQSIHEPSDKPSHGLSHGGSIALAYAGDRTLADLRKPVLPRVLAGLSLQLGQAVAEMHRREVIHHDLTPDNVVLAADGTVTVVDFALATSFAEIRPEFTPLTEIAGTLAYLAPEQTGRTGRPVDHRADLYALGAVLYELATGNPPFAADDLLRLIHDQLAQVPVPPSLRNQAVPEQLSQIIMHLLEKEPDHRYQTADGLVHDLEQLDEAPTAARIGQHDAPTQLLPPSRLVGRDEQVAELHQAFAEALAGGCSGVMISGSAGVGKTALVDELRPVVADHGGWFVAGKFDQYQRDMEFDGANQAFRALGRLLLAEPEDELAAARERMLRAVGKNAGLLGAAVPEFSAVLDVTPDPGDLLTAQVRVQMAGLTALRALASPERPIVMFIDDLQWAGSTPLGFVDTVLRDTPTAGLLMVGAYRDGDVSAPHPLTAPLARWRAEPTVRLMRLANLTQPDVVTLTAELLHVAPESAAELAEEIGSRTNGNPYETVELLNALRRDGVLTVGSGGWRWEMAAVRSHLPLSVGNELVTGEVAAMPEPTRRAVEAMACLGGHAELSVLQAAIDEQHSAPDVLRPALRDGLLVAEPGRRDAVRFRHDRVRETVLNELEPDRRAALHLAMARRLAAVPSLFAVAAEQYLLVLDSVTETDERRTVTALLAHAAERAKLIGDHAVVHALLTGALVLADPTDTGTLVELRAGRHAALYNLGRLDEADDDYRILERLDATGLACLPVTALQVQSLTHRNRGGEAVALGVKALRECGIEVPDAARLPGELDRLFALLQEWLEHTDAAEEVTRPDVTDPALLAAGSLLNAMLASTFFIGDMSMYAWVSLEALRIWVEHGPGHTLVGAAANAAFQAVARRGDYAAAYRAARRVRALAESRDYEPDTSHARLVVSLLESWFQPLELGIEESRRAREGLLAGGDLANAGYTYHKTVVGLLDCAATLDECMAEVEEAKAFFRRTGSEATGHWLEAYQWLADALRHDGFSSAGESIPIERYAGNPLALIHVHLCRAVAAAIFGDPAELSRQAGAAMRLLPTTMGYSVSILVRPLYGLGLATRARLVDGDERDAVLAELDDVLEWLRGRAADGPDNFVHLLRLIEAERAWAIGDFRAAALAFDAARRDAARHRRPWHRALITQRAGRFYLAHGLEQIGQDLLTEARELYLAWGAVAKAEQLDWAHPAPRQPTDRIADAGTNPGKQPPDRPRHGAVTAGAIDMLAILSASRALSAETSVERLHARVVQVLSAMTGATGVHLVLWDEDRQDWSLPVPAVSGSPADGTTEGVRRESAVPLSVLRYLRRTREPLAVSDAAGDDRFSRDPYFDGVTCCSLLAVPVLGRGMLRAVLLLENRLIRGAFTTARLDAIGLVAGQLAAFLDNAQVYGEYRRIADEQAALRRVATLVAKAAAPQDVFDAVAAESGQLLGTDVSALVRYDPPDAAEVVGVWTSVDRPVPTPVGWRLPLGGENLCTVVYRTSRPARIDHSGISGTIGAIATRKWGFQSSVAVPVSVENQLWGAIVLTSMREEPLPADTESRLAGFSELVATAIANAEAQAEVSASRARIVAAADQARQRIERDLHDGAQQRLVSLALQLRDAQAAVPPELGRLGDDLARAVADVNQALDELGEIARGLHPAVLATGGLRPALRALARRSVVPVRVEMTSQQRMPEHVEVSAYYVVAEALTNVAKHARASAVHIQVEVTDAVLRVTVADDGAGGAVVGGGGTGLVGIKDRVEALGGHLRLNSPDGGGTRLTVEFPFTAPAAAPVTDPP